MRSKRIVGDLHCMHKLSWYSLYWIIQQPTKSCTGDPECKIWDTLKPWTVAWRCSPLYGCKDSPHKEENSIKMLCKFESLRLRQIQTTVHLGDWITKSPLCLLCVLTSKWVLCTPLTVSHGESVTYMCAEQIYKKYWQKNLKR